MKYHKTTTVLIKLLSDNKCWFETFEHAPVRTSEEAMTVRPGYHIEQDAKALIVNIKKSDNDREFVMLVVRGNMRFDNSKVKKVTGSKSIRFATPEEVNVITDGVESGGVPPFGNLFSLDVYVDKLLLDNEKIIFNACDRKISLAMKTIDYLRIVNPKPAEIV